MVYGLGFRGDCDAAEDSGNQYSSAQYAKMPWKGFWNVEVNQLWCFGVVPHEVGLLERRMS